VLLLDLHFHCLAIDGVYAADDDGRPQFQPLLPPDNEEIQRLAESLAESISKFFQRRGLGPESDAEESDPLARDEPWLARLYAASISGRAAFGAKAGRQITRMGDRIDPETIEALASPRCASVDGFSLHANVSVPAHDRERLERLARYCARPPIAMERLEVLKDGRVRYQLKRPWRA
jgi:Putative transposase